MNARLVRRLIGLYPAEWKTRYRLEFQCFLETHPSSLKSIFNVIGWGLYERILSFGEITMDQRQHSLALMLYAYLAAIAAGVNFYWTVDDTPLAAAMRNRTALSASWNLVRTGSVLALSAVALVAFPVLLTMLRTALGNRRWDVVFRLAVPPFAGFATLAWVLVAAKLSRGHWIPTPWDVTGDWAAPSNWPPLSIRWALSSVTFVLMVLGVFVSAISIRQAIRRTDLSRQGSFWFISASTLLAGSVGVMALGVLVWGWFVQKYATSDFHARNGGLFSSTNFASWAASCVMFIAATVMAVQGARSALTLKTE